VKLRWLIWGALLLIAALPLPGLLAATAVSADAESEELPSATREYSAIARHLREPFHGYEMFDVLVPQFGIVALSHMAAGLLNVYLAEPDKREEVHGYLREVLARGLSAYVSPTGRSSLHADRLGDYNLFWSHLGLILGIERFVRCEGRVCDSDTDSDRLQKRIAEHLRDRMLATGVYHAPSYPGSPMWPADQTVSLLAMKMYDATHGTSLHEEPLRGFLRTLDARRDPRTGLYPSTVAPAGGGEVPRGCATAWTALYLAQLDPAAAFDQYDRAVRWLGKDVLGVGGFREWPAGRAGSTDVDSGPVVFGVGVAASGLGLGPARIFHDSGSYTTIRRSVLAFGVPAWLPSRGYWAAPLLGEAILFHGRTARAWFGDAPRAPLRQPPAPIGPWLLVLLDACAIAGLTWRLHRSRSRSPAVFHARGAGTTSANVGP
jgi:hypothetical protein